MGAARALLDVARRVVVDDVRHRGHVDAAAEHVRADDHLGRARARVGVGVRVGDVMQNISFAL